MALQRIAGRIADNYKTNPWSASAATALLGLGLIASIVLTITATRGPFSGAIQKFMKTGVKIAGHDAGRNWMYVLGGGAATFVLGGVATGLSFRKPTIEQLSKGLPEGYAIQTDDNSKVYYRNTLTGDAQWERPTQAAENLPNGWVAKIVPEGQEHAGHYFYQNTVTEDMQWERPTAAAV